MTRKHLFHSWLSLGLILMSLTPASAADLRATFDNRTVVRTVSLQQTDEELEAPEPVADSDDAETEVSESGPVSELAFAAEYSGGEMDCLPYSCPNPCFGSDHTWVGLDYLMWWRSGRYFPALVTTEPNQGQLPDATVLFGGGRVAEQARPGGRLEIGHWFDADQCLGLGGRLTVLSNSPLALSLPDENIAFVARPVYPVDSTALVANGTSVPGTLNLQAGSEVLASDVFIRWLLCRSSRARLDLVAGYQYARIAEDLTIDTVTTAFPEKAEVRDSFLAQNEYQAGNFGLRSECRFGQVGLELLTRFGFGNMHESLTIAGTTTTTNLNQNPLQPATTASGLLAQAATNSGTRSQDAFSYMQDLGLKLAYYPTERMKLSLGYSMMYWSSVVRPGEHIDLNVELTPAPGVTPTHPAFAFHPSSFVVHGLNLGLECRF